MTAVIALYKFLLYFPGATVGVLLFRNKRVDWLGSDIATVWGDLQPLNVGFML